MAARIWTGFRSGGGLGVLPGRDLADDQRRRDGGGDRGKHRASRRAVHRHVLLSGTGGQWWTSMTRGRSGARPPGSKQQHLLGGMVWQMPGDTTAGTLMTSLDPGLRGPGGQPRRRPSGRLHAGHIVEPVSPKVGWSVDAAASAGETGQADAGRAGGPGPVRPAGVLRVRRRRPRAATCTCTSCRRPGSTAPRAGCGSRPTRPTTSSTPPAPGGCTSSTSSCTRSGTSCATTSRRSPSPRT